MTDAFHKLRGPTGLRPIFGGASGSCKFVCISCGGCHEGSICGANDTLCNARAFTLLDLLWGLWCPGHILVVADRIKRDSRAGRAILTLRMGILLRYNLLGGSGVDQHSPVFNGILAEAINLDCALGVRMVTDLDIACVALHDRSCIGGGISFLRTPAELTGKSLV